MSDDHAGLRLTQADFDALILELHELRRRYRIDLERRLRTAREFGSPADDDDVLTVFEEIAVDEARISQLEELVRSAVVVADDPAFDGSAGLGCRVEVTVAGRPQSYRLVGRRGVTAEPQDVSLASPVGAALAGRRQGDVVSVLLPSGVTRVIQVVAVSPPASGGVATLRRMAVPG